MLDEILRTDTIAAKQVVPDKRKCQSRRFSARAQPKPQTFAVGDGANYQRLPRHRRFGQEGANQGPERRIRPANP